MNKKPYYFNEKPPKCLYCESETKFESTSQKSAIGNIPLDQPQDWYRCTKCFRMTPIG